MKRRPASKGHTVLSGWRMANGACSMSPMRNVEGSLQSWSASPGRNRSGKAVRLCAFALLVSVACQALAQTSHAARSTRGLTPNLQLAILTPTMVFLGVEHDALSISEIGKTLPTPSLAGHIIAVTVVDAHGTVNVSGNNHDHERQVMLAAQHMNNTPMPSGVSFRKGGWTFSYANTVLARAVDRHLPVVYTASMP